MWKKSFNSQDVGGVRGNTGAQLAILEQFCSLGYFSWLRCIETRLWLLFERIELNQWKLCYMFCNCGEKGLRDVYLLLILWHKYYTFLQQFFRHKCCLSRECLADRYGGPSNLLSS